MSAFSTLGAANMTLRLSLEVSPNLIGEISTSQSDRLFET
jgi:hypothetical protein